MIPNNNGSVGKETPTPKSKSCRFTDKGVKKTIPKSKISKEYKSKRIISKAIGNKEIQ